MSSFLLNNGSQQTPDWYSIQQKTENRKQKTENRKQKTEKFIAK